MGNFLSKFVTSGNFSENRKYELSHLKVGVLNNKIILKLTHIRKNLPPSRELINHISYTVDFQEADQIFKVCNLIYY